MQRPLASHNGEAQLRRRPWSFRIMTIFSSTDSPAAPHSSRQEQGKYRNHAHTPREGLGQMLRIMWNMIFHKPRDTRPGRSEEHTSELQSLMRISYAVFCLKKKNTRHISTQE